MKKLVGKFGKFIVATFIIMGFGLILFLLTPLLIRLFNFDSDIFGAMIFVIGLILCAAGFLLRWVRRIKQVR